MRALTKEEIEKLSNRKNVKKIAVENFLLSLDENIDKATAIRNLNLDANAYGWNDATYKAILDGINLAYEEN